ncbi:hypothetical protein CERSUDRAFT_122676 [Gelatoporia subvermispora B]|uniref:BTB domain-containing protein n=1 Tax=Ceriporiopsis subvermispora (strain B) TaxID=914234 RepID=M2R3Y3_CERS8|nr:hypothetical protein CERSUDRAFT_122676 [Gelatoporia subvermispora B]
MKKRPRLSRLNSDPQGTFRQIARSFISVLTELSIAIFHNLVLRRADTSTTIALSLRYTVLASSDNVAFRVHSQILSEASSVFEDMFSLPKATLEEPSHMPTNTFADVQPTFEGLPCISVSEKSGTLEHLLRICYPVQDPSISSLEKLDLVLEAAIKYNMPGATGVLKARLREFIQDTPLAVYCIACRHDDRDTAAYAAQEVYTRELQDDYVPQLRQISLGCYNRLLRYGRDHHKMGTHRGQKQLHSPWRNNRGARRGQKQLPPPSFSFIREPRPDNTDTTMTSSPRSPSHVTGSPSADISESHQTAACPTVHDASFTQFLRHSDVILRSRDGHEYPVHEDILMLASPHLAQKVRDARAAYGQVTPEDADEAGTGKPIVTIEEDGSTLSLLLRMIYPVDAYSSDLLQVDTMCRALAAARKHQIRVIAEGLISRLTTASEHRPMETFFAYLEYGMVEEAKRAVPMILTKSKEELYRYFPEMDSYGLSGDTYFQLLQYHRQCQQAALLWSQRLPSSGITMLPISQDNGYCSSCGSYECRQKDDFSRHFSEMISAGNPCMYAARPMGAPFSFLSKTSLHGSRDAAYWSMYTEAFARNLKDALPEFDFRSDLTQDATTE